jgi:hypothetical protein
MSIKQPHTITLNSIHALEGVFDPKVLEGRRVITYSQKSHTHDPAKDDLLSYFDRGSKKVFIEDPASSIQTFGRLRCMGGGLSPDGTVYYENTFGIEALDKNGNSILFATKADIGKLVIDAEKNVLGVVINTFQSYENNRETGNRIKGSERYTTYCVPAHFFIEKPIQHIREILREQVHPENIKALEISDIRDFDYSLQYWALAGNLDSPVFLYGPRPGPFFDTFKIDRHEYNQAFDIQSHTRIDTSQPDDYDPGHFGTKKDRGRAVFAWKSYQESLDPKLAMLVGFLVDVVPHFEAHNREYVRTIIAPARDFLL